MANITKTENNANAGKNNSEQVDSSKLMTYSYVPQNKENTGETMEVTPLMTQTYKMNSFIISNNEDSYKIDMVPATLATTLIHSADTKHDKDDAEIEEKITPNTLVSTCSDIKKDKIICIHR